MIKFKIVRCKNNKKNDKQKLFLKEIYSLYFLAVFRYLCTLQI